MSIVTISQLIGCVCVVAGIAVWRWKSYDRDARKVSRHVMALARLNNEDERNGIWYVDELAADTKVAVGDLIRHFERLEQRGYVASDKHLKTYPPSRLAAMFGRKPHHEHVRRFWLTREGHELVSDGKEDALSLV